LHLDIREFEKKYNRRTPDFYEQYSRGETDDREDYIIWAGLYEMLSKNERQLAVLQ